MELHAFESVCVCVCLCAAGTASCFIITLFPCLTHWAIFTPQSSRSPLDDSRVLVQLACSCTLNLRISTEMHVLLKKLTDLLYLCCYGVCLHRLYVCVCVCVFVCLCACVMCLLGRQWTAACGLCLCIWQQLAPLSLLSGLIVSPPPHSLANRAVTIYLTHTQRHIHIWCLFVSWCKRNQMRCITCACLWYLKWCVPFRIMCVCKSPSASFVLGCFSVHVSVLVSVPYVITL